MRSGLHQFFFPCGLMGIFFHAWLLLPSQCVWPLFTAGPGLDQSGFDGEEIIRVHLICTEGRQNHQV